MSKQLQSRNLSPLARDRLAEMLQKTGHRLTLDDFGYIARIDELARRVYAAASGDEQEFLCQPVPCGNAVLRHPSSGKLWWLRRVASKWFRGDTDMMDALFFYMLSLPNKAGAFDHLLDAKTTADAVNAFMRQLTATEAEQATAISRLYPSPPDSDDEENSDAKEGPVMALLAREYGESPSWWLWEAPTPLVGAMIADYNYRIEAEHRAQQRASRGGRGFTLGGSAKPVAPPKTPSSHNQKRLRLYCNLVERKWGQSDG